MRNGIDANRLRAGIHEHTPTHTIETDRPTDDTGVSGWSLVVVVSVVAVLFVLGLVVEVQLSM